MGMAKSAIYAASGNEWDQWAVCLCVATAGRAGALRSHQLCSMQGCFVLYYFLYYNAASVIVSSNIEHSLKVLKIPPQLVAALSW